MTEFQPGALIDERSAREKQKDYHFGEIVASANPVNWVEKPRNTWRKFPIFDQNGSGSCVAQTIRKMSGIMYWLKFGRFVNFSATDVYQQRANKPGAGMDGYNAFKIWQNGITFNELAPSDEMTDAQMDAFNVPIQAREAGKVFRCGNFIVLPVRDIETIASVIQTTGKPVMIWTFWAFDEWTGVPEVKNAALTLGSAPGRHSTAAVDFTLYEGEKAIVIDESWGKTATIDGQRVLKESFFKVRNFWAAYPINFAFEDQTVPDITPPAIVKPRHTFTKALNFIPWNVNTNTPDDMVENEYQKADVIALQDILKFEGLFPKNVSSTGYYGAVTAKSVLAFQRKYAVASESELTSLAGRGVGTKTIAALNSLYGA